MTTTPVSSMLKITNVTGIPMIDIAIAKLIKGTEDRLSVEILIMDAQSRGELPIMVDGVEWTAGQIIDYGIMITRR